MIAKETTKTIRKKYGCSRDEARRPVRLEKKTKLDGNRRQGQRGKGMHRARRTCR